MILEDIANGTDFLVEAASTTHAERFRHRDLHITDVVAGPDRLQKFVRESKVEQVLHRFLAEEMIDTKDSGLRKRFVNGRIEGLRGREVTTERFLHDDASLCGAPRPSESGNDGTEQTGRDRQIE